ncbi:MAG TPA: CDP-diacylglycerol--serine O-phosphatidyltransferase [Candidatus Altiarchaeales archaeon]|nr:CDP-diacylglycerol--serine O-phosphatidyltransferase [Candidatus Altiarchaeales archaeon]
MKKRGLMLRIPDLLTLVNLMLGFTSIIYTINADYTMAATFILLSVIIDAFDGFFARMLSAESKIGMELDSMADLVSFGVAAGILAYTLYLKTTGGFIVCTLIPVCAAIRLARYNIVHQRSYFTGLPTPAVGGFIASLAYTQTRLENTHLMVIFAVLAYLMVSEIKYPRFTKTELKKRSPTFIMLAATAILPLIDRRLLIIPFTTYILIGVFTETGLIKKQAKRGAETNTKKEKKFAGD